MDLIDDHPELYDKRADKIKLTKIEIEQLRILTVGDKKLFASRSPKIEQLSKVKQQKTLALERTSIVNNDVSPEVQQLLLNWNKKGTLNLRKAKLEDN